MIGRAPKQATRAVAGDRRFLGVKHVAQAFLPVFPRAVAVLILAPDYGFHAEPTPTLVRVALLPPTPQKLL